MHAGNGERDPGKDEKHGRRQSTQEQPDVKKEALPVYGRQQDVQGVTLDHEEYGYNAGDVHQHEARAGVIAPGRGRIAGGKVQAG